MSLTLMTVARWNNVIVSDNYKFYLNKKYGKKFANNLSGVSGVSHCDKWFHLILRRRKWEEHGIRRQMDRHLMRRRLKQYGKKEFQNPATLLSEKIPVGLQWSEADTVRLKNGDGKLIMTHLYPEVGRTI